MRILRELLYRLMENRGAIALHAAGFLWQEYGFLIIGPRGSGKTTLLFHVLEHEEAAYIGNDHTFVMRAPWRMGTFPLVVRCGQAMLAANPRFCSLTSGTPKSQKYELLPSILAQVLGCPPEREAPIHGLLVPNFSPSTSTLAFEKMVPKQSMALILAETYTLEDPWFRRPWIEPHHLSDEMLHYQAATMVQELVENIPVVRFSFGANISAQWSVCERILSFIRG